MIDFDPYQTLEILPTATLADIKQAYRRLVKQFHPDSQHELAHHDRIARVNAAYALLKDPQRRQSYDANPHADAFQERRQQTQTHQHWHRQERQDRQDAELLFRDWVKRIYTPVNRSIHQILKPLKSEIASLAADPFDDTLMADFQQYLSDCREILSKAQQLFRSMPNPSNVAGIAAHLYYSLNHVEDGLNEFEWFTQSYEDSYLASGKEMFRKSASLRREAQVALQSLQALL